MCIMDRGVLLLTLNGSCTVSWPWSKGQRKASSGPAGWERQSVEGELAANTVTIHKALKARCMVALQSCDNGQKKGLKMG
jgi:hypothetical protein